MNKSTLHIAKACIEYTQHVSDLHLAIKEHFNIRERIYPTVEDGLLFAITEISEAIELWIIQKDYIRNHPNSKEKYSKERFAEELGDAIYMLMITGIVAGVDPEKAMLDKMRNQLEKELKELENDR